NHDVAHRRLTDRGSVYRNIRPRDRVDAERHLGCHYPNRRHPAGGDVDAAPRLVADTRVLEYELVPSDRQHHLRRAARADQLASLEELHLKWRRHRHPATHRRRRSWKREHELFGRASVERDPAFYGSG